MDPLGLTRTRSTAALGHASGQSGESPTEKRSAAASACTLCTLSSKSTTISAARWTGVGYMAPWTAAPHAGSARLAPAAALLRARRLERERIRNDDDAAALRLGEAPAAHRLGDAALGLRIGERALLHDRGHDLSRAADGELDHDPPGELRSPRQALLVAELHVDEVLADDPADDVLVEEALHARGAGVLEGQAIGEHVAAHRLAGLHSLRSKPERVLELERLTFEGLEAPRGDRLEDAVAERASRERRADDLRLPDRTVTAD